jgi:hypothetical protein
LALRRKSNARKTGVVYFTVASIRFRKVILGG